MVASGTAAGVVVDGAAVASWIEPNSFPASCECDATPLRTPADAHRRDLRRPWLILQTDSPIRGHSCGVVSHGDPCLPQGKVTCLLPSRQVTLDQCGWRSSPPRASTRLRTRTSDTRSATPSSTTRTRASTSSPWPSDRLERRVHVGSWLPHDRGRSSGRHPCHEGSGGSTRGRVITMPRSFEEIVNQAEELSLVFEED